MFAARGGPPVSEVRILVVDDQYTRDEAERSVFLRRTGLAEDSRGPAPSEAIGRATFCSGQRVVGNRAVNEYEVVKRAVARGQARQPWSMILLDVRFDSGTLGADGTCSGEVGDDEFGAEIRKRLAGDFPDLPVVMLSSKGQKELQDRATPYLSKEGLDSRGITIALLRFGCLSPEQAHRLLKLPEEVVAASSSILQVFIRALECSASDVSVLLLGESGVGKEVVARFIHRRSRRSDGPFVAVNVAAVPRDLLEAELFGHEKGSFTGAVASRPGRFEQASGGTLFLDEIGDMAVEAQAKVLRALQEREIYRVGGSQAERLDIRLICATSRDLSSRIAAGQFREDLFYRINTVPLEIPPLRERSEDVPALSHMLLAQFMARERKTGIALSRDAMDRLQSHAFPGNVRELENVLQRLLTGTGNNRVIGEREVAAVIGQEGAGRRAATEVPATEAPSVGAPIDWRSGPELTLAELPSILDSLEVALNDSALAGAKPRVEEALGRLLRRFAGAALERCRDPISGELNRQRAMQLLTGDEGLKGKGPARVVNQLLGRRQEAAVEAEQLEELVRAWKEGRRRDE